MEAEGFLALPFFPFSFLGRRGGMVAGDPPSRLIQQPHFLQSE